MDGGGSGGVMMVRVVHVGREVGVVEVIARGMDTVKVLKGVTR